MGNFAKHSLKNIELLIYIYFFSLIFQSGSVQAAVMREGFLFQITRLLMIVIPIVIICCLGITKRQIRLLLRVSIAGLSLLFIHCFLFYEGVLQLFYKVLIFIEAIMLIISAYRKNLTMLRYLYNVIIFMAKIFLLMYILTEIIEIPLPYTYLQNNNSYVYKNYFEIFQTYHFNMQIPRLSGIFWEPGVYQIYLNIGLFMFIQQNNKNISELLVIMISILFCQSTTGYCVAALLIAYRVAQSNVFKKNSKKIFGFISFFVFLAISSYIIYLKQISTDYVGGSFYLRVFDIINGINVFIANPLFGVGFNNDMSFSKLDLFGRGSSNGLISWLYMTGLVGMFVFSYPYVSNIMKATGKTKSECFIWFIIVVIFNLTEPMYNLGIMAFLLALEYCKQYLSYNERVSEPYAKY